jgi:hypothetical protein
MTEDTRRFKSSEELANAVFGSALPTAEQQRQREAEHKVAQAPPPATDEPKREGWMPPGTVTTNTDALAFRNGFKMPEDKDLQAGIAKTMAEVVAAVRGRR